MRLKMALAAAFAAAMTSAPALAAGDAATGEKVFARCKACHMIKNGDDVVVRGGQVGPNLYGIVGRQAGTAEGFTQYGDSLVAAGEKGLVWDEAAIAEYVADPQAYLTEYLGEPARSRMTYKVRRGGEDVAAYLASVAE